MIFVVVLPRYLVQPTVSLMLFYQLAPTVCHESNVKPIELKRTNSSPLVLFLHICVDKFTGRLFSLRSIICCFIFGLSEFSICFAFDKLCVSLFFVWAGFLVFRSNRMTSQETFLAPISGPHLCKKRQCFSLKTYIKDQCSQPVRRLAVNSKNYIVQWKLKAAQFILHFKYLDGFIEIGLNKTAKTVIK